MIVLSVTLYDHNRKAYENAITMMKHKGKAAIIHPTGTGKSFIGFHLAQMHPKDRVLWLSPNDYIFHTQLENLKRESTDTVDEKMDNITFLTYARLMCMKDLELFTLKPDWIILDEFHRCGAAEWGRGVERLLSEYKQIPVLGLTATNIRYLDNQRDMAAELFQGNIASEITLAEAMAKGILKTPIYVSSVYSYQNELVKYRKQIEKIQNPGIRNINQEHLEALRRALEKAEGLSEIFCRYIGKKDSRYIVFCASKEHMDEMLSHVLEWFGKVDTHPHVYSMYADDPASKKEYSRFLADESSHLKLLFSINMLNEGIHVKNISGVILFRPTVSPIIYRQQIGRALSVSGDAQPVIFDIVNNFENLYSIKSLEQEFLTAIRYYNNQGERPDSVNEAFRIYDEVKECRELFLELQKSLSSAWEIYYQAAQSYFREHGNLMVPKQYKTADGLSLGVWIGVQRRVRNGTAAGALSERQIQRLDEVGMIWENRLELAWEKNYKAALDYYIEHGNLDVKSDYVAKNGEKLGIWITNQRQQRLNGSRGAVLTKERIARLDEIGMIWDKISYLWEKNYSAANAYYEKYGNLEIPYGYVTKEGIHLGEWIVKLRGIRSGKIVNGRLTEEQIRRLDELDMIWDSSRATCFQKQIKAAKIYYQEHGNLEVPVAYKTKSGIALGRWLNRCKKSPEKLTEEQKQCLTELGVTWKEIDPWEMRYELAKQYYKKHGSLDIPQDYVTKDGIWLGKWIYLQRFSYHSLTAEQREKLNGLGMLWKNRWEQRWDNAYERAEEYYRVHGNMNPPAAYKTRDGYALGRWVREQRRKYRCGKLNRSQISRLEQVGISEDECH